jgi:hypothetical protein
MNGRFSNVDDIRLRAFLGDSLELWRVAGTVEAGDAPVVAQIHVHDDGTLISIERIEAEDMPFRWSVRGGDARARPCGSLVGVLNALRRALGVDRGTAVRIAPSPAEPQRSSFDSASLRSGRTGE